MKPITIYLVVSEDAISAAMVQEVEKEERPVYFISRELHDAEVRYQMIEKVALALVITTQRMRVYFKKHRIIVKTNYPIIKIIAKPDLVGRMIGWAVEYQPRGATKSQVLVNFAAKLSPHPTEEEDSQWILHVDGSSNNRSCDVEMVLEGPGDVLLEQALNFEFKTSNNKVSMRSL